MQQEESLPMLFVTLCVFVRVRTRVRACVCVHSGCWRQSKGWRRRC